MYLGKLTRNDQPWAIFYFFKVIFERERERAERWAERERERENLR